MKIRMTKTVVSGDEKKGDRETLKGGEIVEKAAKDAKALIAAGFAVEVKDDANTDKADDDSGSAGE